MKILFIILWVISLIFLFNPSYTFKVAGFHPLKMADIQKLEQNSKKGNPSTISFFQKRNTLEVEVPRNMSLREFLELYQINMRHIRQQIQQQIGNKVRLKAGQKFTINLTPPEDNN